MAAMTSGKNMPASPDPPEVDMVRQGARAKPDDRFQSAREMADALPHPGRPRLGGADGPVAVSTTAQPLSEGMGMREDSFTMPAAKIGPIDDSSLFFAPGRARATTTTASRRCTTCSVRLGASPTRSRCRWTRWTIARPADGEARPQRRPRGRFLALVLLRQAARSGYDAVRSGSTTPASTVPTTPGGYGWSARLVCGGPAGDAAGTASWPSRCRSLPGLRSAPAPRALETPPGR